MCDKDKGYFLEGKQLTQSLIDSATFAGSNYLLHSVSGSFPKPGIDKMVVFTVSDILVRNGQLQFYDMYNKGGKWSKNAYIALVSAIGGVLSDLIQKKELTTALKNNLMLNGVGFITNTGLDHLIPQSYN